MNCDHLRQAGGGNSAVTKGKGKGGPKEEGVLMGFPRTGTTKE